MHCIGIKMSSKYVCILRVAEEKMGFEKAKYVKSCELTNKLEL